MSRSASRLLFALVLGVLMTGCSSPTARRDESSPYYAVPAGATLELHRALHIRPGSTRAWIQGGAPVPTMNSFIPNCNIEITTRNDALVQQVRPGTFRVRRTQPFFEWVVQGAAPLQVAWGQDNDGASDLYRGYHLWLESAEQPEVRRLSCRGVYDTPANANPPSIAEIRAALGEVATLRLP